MPQTTAQAEAAFVQIAETIHEALTTNQAADLSNLDAWFTAMANTDNVAALAINYGAVRRAFNETMKSMRGALIQSLDEWGASSGVSIPFAAGSPEWFVRMRMYLDDVGVYAGGSVDKKVTALGWTRNTLTSPTGFTVPRLTVDEYGQAIDTGHPGTHTIESITGPGRLIKQLRFTHEDEGRDLFSILGLGPKTLTISSIDENNTSGNMTSNPNLVSTVSDGTTLTSLTGWTLSGTWKNETGSPLLRTQTNCIYATADGAYIEQSVAQEFLPRVPYLPVVWVYPSGLNSGDGVVLNWGGKNQAFTGLTDTTWQALIPDRDVDLFPVQFDDATNGRRIRVTFDNDNATGTLYIGAVYWIPFYRYNSTWWTAFTTTTNPVLGTKATVADTLSIASKNQNGCRLLYLLDGNEEAYLTNVGTNTIADG